MAPTDLSGFVYDDASRLRLSVVEALLVALDRRVEVADVVAAAADHDQARPAVVARFGWSESQASAVLDLQIRRFTASERARIADERVALREQIGI